MNTIDFFAAPSLLTSETSESEDGINFIIGPFNACYDDWLRIPNEMDAKQLWANRMRLPENKFPEPVLENNIVSEEEYIKSVESLIADLKSGECKKVVYSRVTSRFFPNSNVADMVDCMLENANDYFSYCFYHPKVGFWMGATPEALYIGDKKDAFTTMSLAGTLPQELEWDEKNKIEQNFVSLYILQKLDEMGIGLKNTTESVLDYGAIKHLCTEYTFALNGNDYKAVVDALNPTPALCGMPKAAALELIRKYEKHDRSCYGGLVGVDTNDLLIAYVNIRCANFYKSQFRFYSGGGILEYSDAEEEWLETESKRLCFESMLID